MTREEVIQWLEEAREGGRIVRDKKLVEVCDMAIAALREQEERRWIPVKERKPDLIHNNAGTAYSEAVMILTSGGTVMDAIWDGIAWIAPFDFWESWGEKVTHWMPLPELPKEDV